MTNVITPLKELELKFADMISSVTGMENDQVLIQYPREGQPSGKIGTDYAYVKLSPEPDERSITKSRKQRLNAETGKYEVTQYSQRTLTLYIVFYGPNSSALATLFADRLYHPDIKYQLDLLGLYMVPDRTEGPTRLPENHNGQWWERCDLGLRFYQSVVTVSEIDYIEEIDLRTEVQ